MCVCLRFYARDIVPDGPLLNFVERPDTHTEREKASDKIATRIYSVKGLFLVKNVEIILNIIYHHCVDRGKKTLFLVNGLLCAWHIK